MGNTFLHGKGGGSAGLNFKIIGGTTTPSNPKENMIWINTDIKITSWIFSATEPESPTEGMVWISTGTPSPVGFNALKKNGIQIYPVFEKQYTSGAWVDKTAKSYQDGAWVDWVKAIIIVPNTSDFGDDAWSVAGATVEVGAEDMSIASTNITDSKINTVLTQLPNGVSGLGLMSIVASITNTTNSSGYSNVQIGLFGDELGDEFIVGYNAQQQKGTVDVNQDYDISAPMPVPLWFGVKHYGSSTGTPHNMTTTLSDVKLLR